MDSFHTTSTSSTVLCPFDLWGRWDVESPISPPAHPLFNRFRKREARAGNNKVRRHWTGGKREKEVLLSFSQGSPETAGLCPPSAPHPRSQGILHPEARTVHKGHLAFHGPNPAGAAFPSTTTWVVPPNTITLGAVTSTSEFGVWDNRKYIDWALPPGVWHRTTKTLAFPQWWEH